MNIFNFSTRRVGGIRFIKLGRFMISYTLCRDARPIKALSSRRTYHPRLSQRRMDEIESELYVEDQERWH